MSSELLCVIVYNGLLYVTIRVAKSWKLVGNFGKFRGNLEFPEILESFREFIFETFREFLTLAGNFGKFAGFFETCRKFWKVSVNF